MKIEKVWKISESGVYFQILTHDNYDQTNGIEFELFLHKLYAGTTANQRIKYYILERS